MINKLTDSAMVLLYPQKCRACGGLVESAADGPACADCWAETRIFNGTEALCQRCGALQQVADRPSCTGCALCAGADFDRATAGGVYEHALSVSIVSLKSVPALSARIKQLLYSLANRITSNNHSLLIPVPLSARRRLERGFNQAELIADVLAGYTDLPINHSNLVRTKHTPIHRVAMDKKARELTVRDAFQLRFPRMIEGRDIILIDDVMTSGATASYCAKALKKNGAARVDVVTLARAVM